MNLFISIKVIKYSLIIINKHNQIDHKKLKIMNKCGKKREILYNF